MKNKINIRKYIDFFKNEFKEEPISTSAAFMILVILSVIFYLGFSGLGKPIGTVLAVISISVISLGILRIVKRQIIISAKDTKRSNKNDNIG